MCLIAPYLLRVGRGRIGGASGPVGFATPLLRAPLACAAFVACATALLLTASRAGAFSAAIAIIAFALLALIGMRSRGGVAALAATLLVAAGLVSVGGQFALDRLDTLAGDRLHRDVMVETHWRAFQDRPVIGHGLNTFHELNQLYARPEDYHVLNTIGSAHNIYLQALEETGYVGFALFVLMLGPILARLLFAAIEGGSGSEWAAGAFAAALGALTHGFVDFGLQTPAIAALLMFALGAYARRDVQL
jgi:O-antigen ligase